METPNQNRTNHRDNKDLTFVVSFLGKFYVHDPNKCAEFYKKRFQLIILHSISVVLDHLN